MNEEELLKRLREAFSTEAGERLVSLSSSLMDLEKGAGEAEKSQALEVAFREAHSLKGAARSVNLMEIETLFQAVEGVFAAMKRDEVLLSGDLFEKRDEVLLSGDLFDLLHHCVKRVEDSLAAQEGEDVAQTADQTADLVSRLEEAKAGGVVRPSQERTGNQPEPKSERETSPEKRAPEPATEKPTGKEPAPKPRSSQQAGEGVVRSIDAWDKKWGEIESELREFQRMVREGDQWENLSRFLDWNHDFIGSLAKETWGLTKGAEQDHPS